MEIATSSIYYFINLYLVARVDLICHGTYGTRYMRYGEHKLQYTDWVCHNLCTYRYHNRLCACILVSSQYIFMYFQESNGILTVD
jgi:hypothetical protein